MEIAQLTAEAWIDFPNLVLYAVPVILFQSLSSGDSALQGMVFV